VRRRFLVLLTVLLLATVVVAVPAGADDDDPVYLSLGTSLAAGTVADANGDSIHFSNQSYTDQLYQRVKGRVAPNLEHVKLGCPGETALTFEFGGICDEDGLRPIYDEPQLEEALAVIGEGNVVLITIDLGVNDLLQATGDILACPNELCIQGILGGIASDVAAVVAQLRADAPDVPIIAANYYNANLAAWLGYFGGVPAGDLPPNPGFAFLSGEVLAAFNGLLEAVVYGPLGIPVADVAAAFDTDDFADRNGDGTPNNVEVICKLTYMCPDPGVKSNIHPTRNGYKVIAKTFQVIVKSLF
jgi:lysophospholipase L1-like esterase